MLHMKRFDLTRQTQWDHPRSLHKRWLWKQNCWWSLMTSMTGSLITIFIWNIKNVPRWHNQEIITMLSIVWKGRVSIFLHWLRIGKSWNWPDLRTPIRKIRNTQVECARTSVSQFWKLENIWLRTTCDCGKEETSLEADHMLDLVTWETNIAQRVEWMSE